MTKFLHFSFLMIYYKQLTADVNVPLEKFDYCLFY